MIKNVFIHPGVTDAKAYHAPQVRADGSPVRRGDRDYVMSQSRLRDFVKRGPRGWRNMQAWPEKPTRALTWGGIMDTLITTPDRFDEAELKRLPKSERDWPAIAAKILLAHELGNGFTVADYLDLDAGRAQVTITFEWHDEATGLVIPCRACLDYWSHDTIIDLKTSNDVSPEWWNRHCDEYGYKMQMWLYKALLEAKNHIIRYCYQVAQQSRPPFETECYSMTVEQLAEGETQWREGMARYCQCLHTNQWPGATTGWQEIAPGSRRFLEE